MINLGGLYFTLDSDTTGLQSAASRLQSFSQTVNSAFKTASSGADQLSTALQRQESSALSALNRVKSLQDQINRSNLPSGSMTTMLNQLGEAYDQFTQKVAGGSALSGLDFSRAKSKLSSDLGDIQRTLSASAREITQSTRQIESALQEAAEANQQRFSSFMGVNEGPAKSAAASGNAIQEALAAQEQLQGIQERMLQESNQARINDFMGITAATKSARESMASFDEYFANETARLKEMSNSNQARFTNFMSNAPGMQSSGAGFNSTAKSAQQSAAAFQELLPPENAASAWERVTGALNGVGAAALLSTGHFGGLSVQIFAMTSLINDFGGKVAVVAGGLVGLATGLATVTESALDAYKGIQSATMGFTALTQSSAVAATQIEYVRQVSLQAGTDFQSTAKSFLNFYASAKENGQTMDTAQREFKELAMSAATLGLSNEDVQNSFRALEEMMSRGTVSTQQLKRQLSTDLPGAFEIAAQAMGVTTEKLTQMLSKQQVLSADFVPKFLDTYVKVMGVNLGAPIDTLTASIGRLGTQWTSFLLAFNQATGASTIFQAAITGLGNIITGLTTHINQVIGVLGGLTGAFAAFLALQVGGAFIGLVASLGPFIALMTEARTVTEALTVAEMGLNTALSGNLLVALAKIAAVIGGAILGYQLFTNAIKASDSAANDAALGGIESYIKQQQTLMTATASATAEMMKQIEVQNTQTSSLASQLELQANQARTSNPSVMDYAKAFITNPLDKYGADKQRNTRADALQSQADQQLALARQQASDYGNLQDIYNKQSKMKDVPQQLAPKEDKAKHSIDSIENLVTAAENAQEKLNALFQGPENGKLIDALTEAQQKVNGLDPVQIQKATAALNAIDPAILANADKQLQAAGIDTNTLVGKLTAVIVVTKQAQEAATAFASAWDSIKKAGNNIENLQKDIQGLFVGTTNPLVSFTAENATKAETMLKTFDNMKGTKAGADGMAALNNEMLKFGITTGTTLERLTQLLNTESAFAKLKETLTKMDDAMVKANDNIVSNATLAGAYNANPLGGQEAEEAVKRGQAAEQYQQQLQALIPYLTDQQKAQLDINTAVDQYLNVMRQVDQSDYVMKQAKTNADALKTSLSDMVTQGLQGIESWISGTKSLSSALKDLATSFLNMAWKDLIINPVQNDVSNLFRQSGLNSSSGLDSSIASGKMGTSGASGLGGLISSIFGGKGGGATAATSLQGLTSAAMQATLALQNLAQAGGAGGTGGSGGIFGLLGSLFGASVGASAPLSFLSTPTLTPSFTGTDFSGIDTSFGGGRAVGGPVLGGMTYAVNENGSVNEFFTPLSSGTVVGTGGAGNDNSGDFHYHDNTYIDARGATPDAVAALQTTMQAREAKLRRELPSMIDSRVRDSTRRGRYS